MRMGEQVIKVNDVIFNGAMIESYSTQERSLLRKELMEEFMKMTRTTKERLTQQIHDGA
ncbi:MAG TPA: hypothetical protein VNM45_08940 [Bacillus sp. (in: firmicutes)]|nr:hypothetical protein [Bacillus sp. (in: firmicutes)]